MRFRPLLAIVVVIFSGLVAKAEDKHLVLVAGKPSHPPRMHEFNAGVQLLTKSLKNVKGLLT